MVESYSKWESSGTLIAKLSYYILRKVKRRMLLPFYRGFYRIILRFPKRVECPCCGWRGRNFISYRGRKNEVCPQCQSMQRHRFLYMLLKRIFTKHELPSRSKPRALRQFATNPKILHVAPEFLSIGKFLKNKAKDGYLSIDIYLGIAMKVMDIRNLAGIADDSFDLVFACAVLEHVKEEEKALNEIKRVLKPNNGIAILYVPVNKAIKETYEFTEKQIEQDINHHVREYGLDFFERLKKCGFVVDAVSGLAFSNEERLLFGFRRGQCAAVCSKVGHNQ